MAKLWTFYYPATSAELHLLFAGATSIIGIDKDLKDALAKVVLKVV